MTLQVTPVGDINSDTENVPTQTASGGSSLTVSDEGVVLDTAVTSIDFVGTPITATNVGHAVTVTVLSAPSTGGGATRWDWMFGNGSDGSATCDGSTAVAGMSLASGNYTLTRSVAFVDLTINVGVSVYMDGQGIILANGTITNNGTIWTAKGSADASGSTPGAPSPTVAAFTGAGTTGGTPNVSAGGNAASPAIGAAGGRGGASTGGPGSGGGARAGGTVTVPTAANGSLAWAAGLLAGVSARTADVVRYLGGSGGGGGDVATGGGGGAGGPVGAVAARNIAGSGRFTARGGNGGNAVSGNAGGGGGGGGGALWIFTQTNNPASVWTIDAAGGTGGTPSGTGKSGVDGSPGRTYIYVAD